MDFKKFQQWCENKGFVVKMPSGYSKLINLEVSSFESFKGIFNLCMMFFYEELHRQRDEEMKQCLKNLNNQPIALYKDGDNEPSAYKINFKNGSTIIPLNEGETIRSKYWGNIDPKYSDEDFEKVFDYLLTPNDDGSVPMDKLLRDLENREKYKTFKSKWCDLKSKWCDLGKEERNKEYENSELKSLVDMVAEKYDSED